MGLAATGICSMLGAGINVLPFMIQRNVPGIGPNVLPAYLFAALPAILAALAYAILASAQESIDLLHVSFTFPLLCNLNHFYDLCTFDQAPRYIVELLNAIEESGVEARVLVGVLPFQGIENTVAVDLLRREVEKRGLGDQIEFRFFDGLVHAKTALIDDEFLIVGSQNFHYSAFGENDGLTEYSLGVADPQAIDDFKRLFEYHWERSDK